MYNNIDENSLIIKSNIIDPNTGEIMGGSKRVIWSGWKDGAYKYRFKAKPLKLYYDVPIDLKPSEFYVFIQLCSLMNNDNLFLVREIDRKKFRSVNYRALTKEEIFDLVKKQFSISTFNRAWRKLTPRYIRKIKANGFSVWAVNPAIVAKTDYIPLYLYLPFKDDIDPFITELTKKKFKNLEESL